MNLPVSFVALIKALFGTEEYEELALSLKQESPVSLRLNHSKSFISTLPAFHSPQHEIPWCANGYYLDRRLTFTFDPLFHAGCYYVQEASSMFLEQVMKQYVSDRPVAMLDLCAAPGGKSTHARSLLPEGSLLVANEVIRARSSVLSENLTKWGNPDVIVTNNDPADFSSLGSFFDVVLTDVPCSGEGMFRKDHGAMDEWSPENVDICSGRQRRIISDIWPCLKPGGILVYSTCTYNTKENEENVQWIKDELGAEVLPVDVPSEWKITGNMAGMDFPVYRFLPHKTRGEGFFLAVLRKDEDDAGLSALSGKKRSKKTIPPKSSSANLSIAVDWVDSPDKYRLSVQGEQIVAMSKIHVESLDILKQRLRVVQVGIALAEQKGKDTLPLHALAMSNILRQDAFVKQEIDYEQAIAYLRKEAITLHPDVPRGYVLLLYRGVSLGFVKNIGNRANNLYPQEWRIRSGYMPDEILIT